LIIAAALSCKTFQAKGTLKLKQLVKAWSLSSPHNVLDEALPSQLSALVEILNDQTVTPAKPTTGTFNTPYQDRITHFSDDGRWAYSLAMNSKRTGRAENLNGENTRSW